MLKRQGKAYGHLMVEVHTYLLEHRNHALEQRLNHIAGLKLEPSALH